MPITLTAPPMVVEGARRYAEHSGMTLEAFILAYLEATAKRESEKCQSQFYNDELAELAGTWVEDPECEKALEDMRIPTNDIWIASLAVQHSLPLYTRDRHFDNIPQIQQVR